MLIIPQPSLPAIAFQLKTARNIARVAYILSNMINSFYMEVRLSTSLLVQGKIEENANNFLDSRILGDN
jgi:hypothetical protein